MKTILINKANGYKSLKNAFSWKQFTILFLIVLGAGLKAGAQAQPDDVWIRFNNPQYDCYGNTYCLDVEFKSETTLDTLFAVNLRFYYDDNVLEYAGTGNYAPGYALDGPPAIGTGNGSELFGFTGPVEFVNGKLQLMGAPSIELPVDGWLKYCTICFHVDAEITMEQPFCPSIVWDLQENWVLEEGGGFQPGDDGVVITLTDPTGVQDSSPSTEHVVQFNWQYGGNPNGYGLPVALVCIYLGCPIPLSNWSLILAIGLMIITTLFIFKKRMSN